MGASQPKRGKVTGEWDDGPSQFEEELSMFDESEMDAEQMEGQAGHDVIPVGGYCTESNTNVNEFFWCRNRLFSYVNQNRHQDLFGNVYNLQLKSVFSV